MSQLSPPLSPQSSSVPEALRQDLHLTGVCGASLLGVFAFALVLSANVSGGYWLLAALAAWLLVLWQTHRHLHLNRRADDAPLLLRLGLGNRITLIRGWLIAATAGFIIFTATEVPDWLWYLPAVCYSLAAIGDGLDGYVARRQQRTTRLGAELDMRLDALGLLVAPVLAVLLGKLHASYLLVSAAYYLFQGGIAWRQARALPVYPLPPSRFRRVMAGAQMALVAIVLWPPLPSLLTQVIGALVMTPLLIGFIRDWLYVSGRLAGANA